jgi:tetratricopeptide (TPR) repeat protein
VEKTLAPAGNDQVVQAGTVKSATNESGDPGTANGTREDKSIDSAGLSMSAETAAEAKLATNASSKLTTAQLDDARNRATSLFGADSAQVARIALEQGLKYQAQEPERADGYFQEAIQKSGYQKAEATLSAALRKYADFKEKTEHDAAGAQDLRQRAKVVDDMINSSKELMDALSAGRSQSQLADPLLSYAESVLENGDHTRADQIFNKALDFADGNQQKLGLMTKYLQVEADQGINDTVLQNNIKSLQNNTGNQNDQPVRGSIAGQSTAFTDQASSSNASTNDKVLTGQDGVQSASTEAGSATSAVAQLKSADANVMPGSATQGKAASKLGSAHSSAVIDGNERLAALKHGDIASSASQNTPGDHEQDLLRNASIAAEIFGASSPELGKMYGKLAEFYKKRGDSQQALAYYPQAIAYLETSPVQDPPGKDPKALQMTALQTTLYAYGNLLMQGDLQQKQEAGKIISQELALAIEAKLTKEIEDGNVDGKYADDLAKLASCYRSMGDISRSQYVDSLANSLRGEEVQGM